jgi:RecB family endonuclease NucS
MTFQFEPNPSPHTVDDLLGLSKRRDACLLLFARCRVEYDGEVSTTLGMGDRFVLQKGDGTVLVHSDTGHEPQNWQPAGATVQITEFDPLEIVALQSDPRGVLTIECESVFCALVARLDDDAELDLTGSEEDLRTLLFEDPDQLEPGFTPREKERETPAGPVDIWGQDASNTPVIVELKRRRVGPDAVSQLSRYVDSVEQDVRGILVAPSVTERARQLLEDNELELRRIEPPK